METVLLSVSADQNQIFLIMDNVGDLRPSNNESVLADFSCLFNALQVQTYLSLILALECNLIGGLPGHCSQVIVLYIIPSFASSMDSFCSNIQKKACVKVKLVIYSPPQASSVILTGSLILLFFRVIKQGDLKKYSFFKLYYYFTHFYFNNYYFTHFYFHNYYFTQLLAFANWLRSSSNDLQSNFFRGSTNRTYCPISPTMITTRTNTYVFRLLQLCHRDHLILETTRLIQQYL